MSSIRVTVEAIELLARGGERNEADTAGRESAAMATQSAAVSVAASATQRVRGSTARLR
jgi:hypothetical protein